MPTWPEFREGRRRESQSPARAYTGRTTRLHESAGVVATACLHREMSRNTGDPTPWRSVSANRGLARVGTGRCGKSERLVVPLKPGNAGGGKEPWFKGNAKRGANWRLA